MPKLPNPVMWARCKHPDPRASRGEAYQYRQQHQWEVRVLAMSLWAANTWHEDIQPVIKRLHANRRVAGGAVRADAKWNWPAWYRASRTAAAVRDAERISLTTRVGELIGARTETESFLTVVTRTRDLSAQFPVGMLHVLHDYRARVADGQPRRPFSLVWYLAAAPDEAKRLLDIPAIGIGDILVDAAVQASAALTADPGWVLLHADKTGGQRLLDFYGKCGMHSVPRPPQWLAKWRKNDGRYFFYEPELADRFAVTLDDRRENPHAPWK